MSTLVDTRQNKKLTNLQVFKLFDWIQQKIESFEPGISLQAVANSATNALQFEVNTNHIQGALEQLELRLPRGPISNDVKLGILRRAVESLYKSLGQELPAEWADL